MYFSGTVFGDTFPSNVLAVAVWWYNPVTNQRLESDVIFNTAYSWNSYRGPLSGVIDIKLVALHEFGHVLGLHHPDQSGQSVTAIMNSVVGNPSATS